MTQSALDFGDRYKAAQAWTELLEAFSAVVKVVGPKEAAYQLDVSPTDLHNALAERSRRYVKAAWTPWLIMADETDRALQIYAGLRGYDLTRKRVLTPAEELAELRAAMTAECGPTQIEAIERRVNGGAR